MRINSRIESKIRGIDLLATLSLRRIASRSDERLRMASPKISVAPETFSVKDETSSTKFLFIFIISYSHIRHRLFEGENTQIRAHIRILLIVYASRKRDSDFI